MSAALGNTGQGTKHVVIVDDTPSMADRWGEKGDKHTSFQVARDQIKQVARQAALANSAQEMQIFLLSDLLGRFKVTDESLAVLGSKTVPADVLAKLKPLVNEAYDREQFLEELEQRPGGGRPQAFRAGPAARDRHRQAEVRPPARQPQRGRHRQSPG